MTSVFAVNPNARVHTAVIGAEREPLLVVDDLWSEPGALADLAARAAYDVAKGSYPGLRTAAPEAYSEAIWAGLGAWLRTAFAIPEATPTRLSSFYSVVTQRGESLRPVQRIPHTDMYGPCDLTLVHYLCGPEFGGTAFFRHRSTGFEAITYERRSAYEARINTEMNALPLAAAYADEGHPLFDKLGVIHARFNRLVAFRSRLLHSPAVAGDGSLPTDPAKGRLTVTAFLTSPGEV